MKVLNSLKLYGPRWPIFVAWRLSRKLNLIPRLRLFLIKFIADFQAGSNVRLGRRIRFSPFGKLSLGNDVHIGDYCTFEVKNGGSSLEVGDRTWISHHCHIQASAPMTIGRDVLIGEFVSIRDTVHSYASSAPIRQQQDSVGPIIIEDNVWVGRGAAIISNGRALKIGTGSIIGANAVVTRSVPPNSVWAGVPAKQIVDRSFPIDSNAQS